MGLNIISNIWVADFETTTANTKYYQENKDVCVVYGYMKQLYDDNEYEFLNIQDMLDYLIIQGKGAMIYFHNLSFDGDFILKHITKTYKMYNELPRNRKGFTTLRQQNNIYEITLQTWSKTANRVIKLVFRCSYRILSAGVAALGKDVGLAKYTGDEQEDFYDVEPVSKISDLPKEYVEYCKRDVEIVKRSLLQFEESIEWLKGEWKFLKSFKWNGKLTASSISLKLQKSYVYDAYGKHITKGFKHTTKENDLASNFYFGGFTQFNSDYHDTEIKCKRGVCIDINSAHPFSMTKKLPFGNTYDADEITPEDLGYNGDNVLWFYEIYVENAESRYGGIACLANWVKINNSRVLEKHEIKYRYVFNLRDFTCYYMKEEWELMNKFYEFEGVVIKKKYWMFAKPFLKEFVDKMYKFKSDFKKDGKGGLSNTFKIILNSGYGIHAKRNDFKEYYVCKDKKEYDKLKPFTRFYFNKKEYMVSNTDSTIHLLENQYIRIVERVELPKANNKFIASAITAYSRIYLLEHILKFGVKNVLYADTDSIYVRDYKGELSDYAWIDKYELGAWDVECEYTKFLVKGAKVYYAKKGNDFVKSKYSGVNSKWLKDNLSYDTFKCSVLRDAKLAMESCKSGKLLVTTDYSPKERNH